MNTAQTDAEPLFSILIANYNNGRFLKTALDSVRQQTYTNWEVVLVDDGSVDESEKIYAGIAGESRIRILKNEENRGCGFTKNRCAEAARGEFCGFLDPDDSLLPTALEEMVRAFENHPKAALIYSTHYFCNEQMEITGINPNVREIPANHSYLTSRGQTVSVSHFAAFRTRNYRQTPGIDPTLMRAVDQDLYYKLEETGALVFLNKPLYHYRQHKGGISTSANNLKAMYWHTRVLRAAYYRRKHLSNGLANISRRDMCRYFSQFYLWQAMEKAKQRQKGKALYCLWQSFRYSPFDQNFLMRIKMLAGLFKS